MRIRTKITLWSAALVAAVVASVALASLWVERSRAKDEAQARTEALLEGIQRIARESASLKDDLMLLSYLKSLLRDYPELEQAVVTRGEHVSVLGQARSTLYHRDFTAAHPETPIKVRVGFSQAALEERVHKAWRAALVRILLAAAIALGLGALGSLWLGRRLARPIMTLSGAAYALGEGRFDVLVEVPGGDEISHLAKQFNLMAYKLRELVRFREDLLGTLSHELNTPLTGLKGHLEYLREGNAAQDSAQRQEAYRIMSDTVHQMESSLANALHLTRSVQVRPTLKIETLCVNDVLDEVLRLFGPTARANGVELAGPEGLPAFLAADPEMIRRVAVNLVSNALKYTPSGGVVRVIVSSEDGHVRLSVSDTGPGIKPEDREQIFTKFYRAAGPGGRPQRIPGSGLGLAIAKQAVDLHGGKIWVESDPGIGSTFHVSLPKGGSAEEGA